MSGRTEDAATHDDGLTEPRVSTFELFFDLVFVFAFTRITESIAEDTTWRGMGRGVLIFAMLWWAWGAYAWLTNSVRTDDGPSRIVLSASMGAVLVVAIAVPDAFGDSGPAFAFGYLVVILLHGVLFSLAADSPTDAARGIRRLAPTNLGSAALLVGAAFTDDALQTTLWIVAVGVTFAGPFLTGVADFTVRPAHFVERHGLIVIVALGESIVAVGAAESHEVDAALAVSALVAMALISGLWWAYFDGESAGAEHALHATDGADRSRMARDIYSYLHIPLVLGVVLAALGIKKTLQHSDEDLATVAAVALGGGVALFYAALAGIRLRRRSRAGSARLAAVVAATALIPVATQAPAIVSLTILAALTLVVAVATRAARAGQATPPLSA
ncbi:MAG: low temperature requirement protein A [Acidimicrobiales bacterium]